MSNLDLNAKEIRDSILEILIKKGSATRKQIMDIFSKFDETRVDVALGFLQAQPEGSENRITYDSGKSKFRLASTQSTT